MSPCKNGGSCADVNNDFKCYCEPPFTGRTCETKMNPCQYNKCSNGATCTPSTNYQDYYCTCPLGFTGRYCDEDINECKNNPCR